MTVRRTSHAILRGPRRIPAIRRHSGNPYFNKGRHHGQSFEGSGRLLLVFGLPALFLVVIGYLIWGPTFTVKNVKIEGATAETEKSLRQIVDSRLGQRRLLPSNNVFFFDKDGAAADIAKSFYLDGLEIKKRLPGTVELKVVEKTVRGALLADGRFLGLDGVGFVVRELTATEVSALGPLPPEYGQAVSPELGAEAVTIGNEGGGNPKEPGAEIGAGVEAAKAREDSARPRYPVITLDRMRLGDSGDYKAGSQPLSTAVMALILQSFTKLEEYSKEPVRRFVSRGPDADSVEVVMDGGWKAYFSAAADQPFDLQANKLTLILTDKVGDRRSELEYIDLRYGERIFFKFKTPDQKAE